MRLDRMQISPIRDLRCVFALPALSVLMCLTGCNLDSFTSGATTPAQQTTTVTDGTPLPPLATVSVTISWTPPVENTDGSALTDLAGYYIHYGTEEGLLTNTIKIPTPGITTYTVNDLSRGNWFFAIRSYNSSGTESAPSVTASTEV